MALDTRYRPQRYEDVLGQDATVAILKQIVVENHGYHQSYVFCGQYGSGKTTLARIFARALLCSHPQQGSPCDQCPSCLSFLSNGVNECFEELDAATKSGKADLARIVDDVTYATVSGKRRIYLMDEAHRLSKASLDTLLKPMEDSVPGSDEKKLICIFCTTEPEKMVSTIFSRCAPAFVIRPATIAAIAERLAYVCNSEKIPFEREALLLIAEQSETHIRDALKMTEGVALSGAVTKENAVKYLHLDANNQVLDLLGGVMNDLPSALKHAEALAQRMSPMSVYERVAEASLLLYRVHLGVAEVPMKWDRERVASLSAQGPLWLNVVSRFAAPPHRPSLSTLMLDLANAHHLFHSKEVAGSNSSVIVISSTVPSTDKPTEPVAVVPTPKEEVRKTHAPALNTSGIYIDPRAIGRGPQDRAPIKKEPLPELSANPEFISPGTFRELVRHHLWGLKGGRAG